MNTQYVDSIWLKTFNLRKENVLDYFSTSPFYDPSSNNQILNTQGISSDHLLGLTGLEYSVDLEHSKEPHLFVINKGNRRSPTFVDIIEVYYCIDGVIYQSPFFLELLRARISKAALHLQNSFETSFDRVMYRGQGGYCQVKESGPLSSSKVAASEGGEEGKDVDSKTALSISSPASVVQKKAPPLAPQYHFKHVFNDIANNF